MINNFGALSITLALNLFVLKGVAANTHNIDQVNVKIINLIYLE